MAKVGWPEYPDLQNLDANNGVQRAQRFISPDGVRQDTARKYLHPKLRDGKHPNLHVLVENQVVRVLFDEEDKASGIEFRSNPAFQNGGHLKRIKARKMVIVTCGALGTPTYSRKLVFTWLLTFLVWGMNTRITTYSSTAIRRA